MSRNVIFISHATPEDNEFTIWLASKLELLGYEVWIDKNKLLGGESFWKEIDEVIRNKTVKFLLVYSWNICYQRTPGQLKNGIENELELAKSVAGSNSLKDFIIPLKIDDSPYNLFVGMNVLNQIDFYHDGWGAGLKQLIKKFDSQGINIQEQLQLDFTVWFKKDFVENKRIISKQEFYITSNWEFDFLPSAYYLRKYENNKQAKTVAESLIHPHVVQGNILASFEDKIPSEFTIGNEKIRIKPKQTYYVDIMQLYDQDINSEFPTTHDMIRFLIDLIKKCLYLLFENRGLKRYELSGNKFAFYYQPGILEKDKIKFEYPYNSKKKTKSLIGSMLDRNWHYALRIHPRIHPNLHLNVFTHIVFTIDGNNVKDDPKKQHSLRRKWGAMKFNKEWRDLLLAGIQGLKVEDKIEVQVSNNQTISMKQYPQFHEVDFGFKDP